MEQTFYKFFRPMEALGGIIIFSLGVNLFITPVNLYNGGVLGICQLIRSCLTLFGNFSFGGMDIAGILYYLFNVPLFFLAFKGVSRPLLPAYADLRFLNDPVFILHPHSPALSFAKRHLGLVSFRRLDVRCRLRTYLTCRSVLRRDGYHRRIPNQKRL